VYLEQKQQHGLGEGLTLEEVQERDPPLAAGASTAYRLLYESAIYLTSEIRTNTDELLKPIFEGGFPFEEMGDLATRMRAQTLEIARMLRSTYLEQSLLETS